MTTPRDRDWSVTTDTERAITDEQGRAEVTFTVTNLRDTPAQAALTVTTDTDEARSWFTVTDPVRTIDADASSSFGVTIRVPPGTPAATYAFQVNVRTLGGTSDEPPILSNRVVLEVPTRPPSKRISLPRPKILILAGAGVVAVLLVIAIVVVLITPGDSPSHLAVSPSAGPPNDADTVPVPDVVGHTDIEAIRRQISVRGLVPVIKYRFVQGDERASSQHPAPNDRAMVGDPVVVTFDVRVTAPTALEVRTRAQQQELGLPVDAKSNRRQILDVDLFWDQTETFVGTWQVMFFSSICYFGIAFVEIRDPLFGVPAKIVQTVESKGLLPTGVEVTNVKQLSVTRVQTSPSSTLGDIPFSCPEDLVYVAAVDDFGNLGPLSEPQGIRQ
jgi:hypothetical protein